MPDQDPNGGEGEEPFQVPPLTRGGYQRGLETEAQIRSAVGLSTAELKARVAVDDRRNEGFLSAEALVFLIRQADQESNRARLNSLFPALIDRCQAGLRKAFRGFGPEDREDLQQQVLRQLVQDILAEDDRGDFLQVRFFVVLQRRATTAAQARRRDLSRTQSLDEPVSAEEPDGETKVDLAEGGGLSPEDLAQLGDALALLTPRQREVYILRHVYGFAIGKERREDEDPDKPSLAVHFDVSSKTIQTWLRAADAALAPYRKA